MHFPRQFNKPNAPWTKIEYAWEQTLTFELHHCLLDHRLEFTCKILKQLSDNSHNSMNKKSTRNFWNIPRIYKQRKFYLLRSFWSLNRDIPIDYTLPHNSMINKITPRFFFFFEQGNEIILSSAQKIDYIKKRRVYHVSSPHPSWKSMQSHQPSILQQEHPNSQPGDTIIFDYIKTLI